jgi:ribonuclease T2
VVPPSAPGSFDFYLLSLSWAPQFCSAPDEAQRNPAECARGRGISFSVHGLWPETNQGASPESCAPGKNIPAMVPKPVINLILDYMYSPGLIQHEWTTHGLCTGLTPSDYFTEVLQARAAIQLPVEFSGLDQTIKESPAQIEAQFARSNELYPAQAFRTACAGGALAEVRICFDKNLKAQACPARVADCSSASLTILPVR